jgi:hypothetical protein
MKRVDVEPVLIDNFQVNLKDDDVTKVNWEATKKLQEMPKYMRFNDWLNKNGAKRDSIIYPAAFGAAGKLIGIAATRDIGLTEAYLFVPSKMIICEEKFRQNKKIGHILDENPDVFTEHFFGEHLVIIFFMMYEMGKGEDSFWFSYFETAELTDMLNLWGEDDLAFMED